MKKQMVVIFAVLLLLALSSRSNAYPGATRAELERRLELKSVCYESSANTYTVVYLYNRTVEIRPGSKSCPERAAVRLRTVDQQVDQVTKVDGVTPRWYGYYNAQGSYLVVVRHRAEILSSNGQVHFEAPLSEKAYDAAIASASTVRDSYPMKATVDFIRREIRDLAYTPNSNTQQDFKLVSTCRDSQGSFGYTAPVVKSSDGKCPDSYMLAVYRTSQPVTDVYQSTFNRENVSSDGYSKWYSYDRSYIEIRSRFGHSVSKYEISGPTSGQIELDLTTARPDSPVSLVYDTETKYVLKVKPSVSPYAL